VPGPTLSAGRLAAVLRRAVRSHAGLQRLSFGLEARDAIVHARRVAAGGAGAMLEFLDRVCRAT